MFVAKPSRHLKIAPALQLDTLASSNWLFDSLLAYRETRKPRHRRTLAGDMPAAIVTKIDT
jgi:hypothetical protein